MTFFVLSDADVWDSPGEKSASIDLMCAEADVLQPQRWSSQRGDTVIPEYRPDSCDLIGILVYASSSRRPRRRRPRRPLNESHELGGWVWVLHGRGAWTICDNMIEWPS